MSFEIESGIPVPDSSRNGKTRYPFAAMKVGDSFFIPAGSGRAKNIGSAAFCWRRTTVFAPGVPRPVFTVRTVKNPDGVRIWRIS